MKDCFKCGVRKPLREFYKHKRMADGHLNKCKDCARRDVNRNRAEKIDLYRAKDRERAGLDHRVVARRAYYLAAQADPVKRKREEERRHAWRRRNEIKRKAHTAVNNAVRRGKLSKPDACEQCGDGMKRLHAHHDDYTRQLDVVWLCHTCHGRRHRELNEMHRSAAE